MLLPVCVFADVGFHPTESSVFFSPKTTNNLLNFNLLQTADTSNTVKGKTSFSIYAKEAMGGLCGGVLGGLIGAGIPIVGLTLLGAIFGRHIYDDPSAGDIRLLVGGCIGAPLGAIIELPKGIRFVGEKLGEDGDYWNTFLGMAIGSGAGMLVGGTACGLIDEHYSGVLATVVGVGIGSIFSIAGAVCGYNW